MKFKHPSFGDVIEVDDSKAKAAKRQGWIPVDEPKPKEPTSKAKPKPNQT